MPRFFLAIVLGAGVIFGFGSGFASLAGHGGGGWDHCPHAHETQP